MSMTRKSRVVLYVVQADHAYRPHLPFLYYHLAVRQPDALLERFSIMMDLGELGS